MPEKTAPETTLMVRCIVACVTDTGPDLAAYKVRCTREQYEAGEHGGAAEEQARRDGFDACLVFTPDDPPTWLFPQMDWETAKVIDLAQNHLAQSTQDAHLQG